MRLGVDCSQKSCGLKKLFTMKHDLLFSQMVGSTSFLKLWALLKGSVSILTDDVANLAIYLELLDCVSAFLHLINTFVKFCMLSLSQ